MEQIKNKYTMKIFDNETGKLVKNIDFNDLISGYSTKVGETNTGGTLIISDDDTDSKRKAIYGMEMARQKIIQSDPAAAMLSIFDMI